MKPLLFILFSTISLLCFSQREYVHGVVSDEETKGALAGAHVVNITTGKLAVADHLGRFRIPALTGDTLKISYTGYQVTGWIVEDDWFNKDKKEFLLPVDTIYLKEVVVGTFPEYERFKQLILETEPEDTFEVYGLASIPPLPPIPTESDMQKPVTIIGVTFDVEKLTKKGKEKKKMQKILERKKLLDKAYAKFNRDWVAEQTELEGDELTTFIAYCNFSPEYLAETPLFLIYEKMMVLLEDFKSEGSQG